MTIITTFITPYIIKWGWKFANTISTPKEGNKFSFRFKRPPKE